MTLRLFSLLAVVVLLVTACGDDDDDAGAGDPGDFATTHIDRLLKGQWARAYETLHPEHKAIVDADVYIECNTGEIAPDLEVSVDEVFEETINVPRIGEQETTAVTLEFTHDEGSNFTTMHAVEIDGSWHWMMTGAQLDAYEAAECP